MSNHGQQWVYCSLYSINMDLGDFSANYMLCFVEGNFYYYPWDYREIAIESFPI